MEQEARLNHMAGSLLNMEVQVCLQPLPTMSF